MYPFLCSVEGAISPDHMSKSGGRYTSPQRHIDHRPSELRFTCSDLNLWKESRISHSSLAFVGCGCGLRWSVHVFHWTVEEDQATTNCVQQVRSRSLALPKPAGSLTWQLVSVVRLESFAKHRVRDASGKFQVETSVSTGSLHPAQVAPCNIILSKPTG